MLALLTAQELGLWLITCPGLDGPEMGFAMPALWAFNISERVCLLFFMHDGNFLFFF